MKPISRQKKKCHPEEDQRGGGGGENIVCNRITVNAGGARGNTNRARARARLGSMCILQAGNHPAHWGVKKDLCNGCSVCPPRTKCRAIVNQVHEDEGRRDLFIYLRRFQRPTAPSGIQNLQMYRLILVSCCWKSANNLLHRLRASEREWQADGWGVGVRGGG